MTTTCTMILGDCLDLISKFPQNYIDLFFADLPYVCSKNSWDVEVDLVGFFKAARACSRATPAMAFTCNARLGARLIASNPKMFRYDLVWQKARAQGYLDAKRRPLRGHENIYIFSEGRTAYNPQMRQGKPYNHKSCGNSRIYGSHKGRENQHGNDNRDRLYPVSVINIKGEMKFIHPTQKPVALLDWIIRTYSNAGDMVLDPTAGSGTTAVSACQNGRSVVCIEKDEGYFESSVERVRKHIRDNLLDVKLEVRK